MRIMVLIALVGCGGATSERAAPPSSEVAATPTSESEEAVFPQLGLCSEAVAYCIDVPAGTTEQDRYPTGVTYVLPGGQEVNFGYDQEGRLEDALQPDASGHDVAGTFFQPDMVAESRALEDPPGMYWRIDDTLEDGGAPEFSGASILEAPGGVVSCVVAELGADDADPCATLRER